MRKCPCYSAVDIDLGSRIITACMNDKWAERRRFPRYFTRLEVAAYSGSNTIKGWITQIGRGGCLIVPTLPPPQSPELRLSIQLADGLPPVNCIGEIVYSIRDKGTGVAFREISVYNQDRITEFFEGHAAPQESSGAQSGS